MSDAHTPGDGGVHELPAGLVREALAPDRLVLLWSRTVAEAVLTAVQDADEMLLVVPSMSVRIVAMLTRSAGSAGRCRCR